MIDGAYDGWVLLGEGWPTLGDACAATGLSYRSWAPQQCL